MAPSKFGFKDVINQWKAEKWEPEKLMALYKRAGAQYFLVLFEIVALSQQQQPVFFSVYRHSESPRAGKGISAQ
jgi:hypothetical protein